MPDPKRVALRFASNNDLRHRAAKRLLNLLHVALADAKESASELYGIVGPDDRDTIGDMYNDLKKMVADANRVRVS